jgi:hypothetical protein
LVSTIAAAFENASPSRRSLDHLVGTGASVASDELVAIRVVEQIACDHDPVDVF